MPKFLDAIAGFGVTFSDDVQEADHRRVSGETGPGRSRAITAATNSTGTPTAWRSASAASCARGPARPTRSSSRAPTTPRTERFSPGERYGRVYQINYLRCIGCGLCIEACPTRALTMTNDYEMADDNRADLIYGKDKLLAPLQPGMQPPPHPMAQGTTDDDYYLRQHHRRSALTTESRSSRFTLLAAEAVTAPPRRGGHVLGAGRGRGGGAVGVVAAPKAVYSAIFLAITMICLAVLYMTQDALFLGVVQVVVYTGAVMMLFLFVLMLIGVDSVGVAGGNHSRTTPCGPGRRCRVRHSAGRRHRHTVHVDRVRRARRRPTPAATCRAWRR